MGITIVASHCKQRPNLNSHFHRYPPICTHIILYRCYLPLRRLFRDSRNGIRLTDTNSCSLLIVIPAASGRRPGCSSVHPSIPPSHAAYSSSVNRRVRARPEKFFLPLFRQGLFRHSVYFMMLFHHYPPSSTTQPTNQPKTEES